MRTLAGITFEVVGRSKPVPLEELERCERQLGCIFPECYREFITQVGAGYFEDIPIRVSTPQRIVESTNEDRERLKEYWFWDESAAVLSQERGVASIECFDTDIGHDLRFLPSDPSRIYF